jgi:TolA-binding protein
MTGLRAFTLSGALLVSGCSFVSDSVWPSLAGEDDQAPAAATSRTVATVATAQAQASGVQPALGDSNFSTPVSGNLSSTGTIVGQKVQELSGELRQLQSRLNQRNGSLQQIRSSTVENAQRYHGTIAAMEAKLQVGSTPGNPVLINQWNQAQGQLDAVSRDIAGMNQLANDVAADSSLAVFLLESARATYGISGAVDQDHANLAVLEDDINRTHVVVDRLLNELSEDVSRQTAYVGNERRSLGSLALAIKNGELYGASLASRAFVPANAAFAARGGAAPVTGRPLVVIRFDRPNVDYKQALYTAVSRALDQRPEARFDLVAVSPSEGSPADVALMRSQSRKRADEVLQTLTGMGLPADRVGLASTTNPGTRTSEVHIYVR